MTFVCPYCSKIGETARSSSLHKVRCPKNPERKLYQWSLEKRKEQAERSREENRKYWTEENRNLHSKRMQKIVQERPESYSKENVSGRVKIYSVLDTKGVETRVKGTWELLVARSLTELSIEWSNSLSPFTYTWNETNHSYFPDFYLPVYDVFLEVKGYKTKRDLAKWSTVNRLLILEETQVQMIKTQGAPALLLLVESYISSFNTNIAE